MSRIRAGLYSAAGELWVFDDFGNAVQLTDDEWPSFIYSTFDVY